jgi:hypothetical protein
MWFYIIIGVFSVSMGLAVHVLKWYFRTAVFSAVFECL